MPSGVYVRSNELMQNLRELGKELGKNSFGRKHTQETKQKMKLAKLGRKLLPHSAEWNKKISVSHMGKKHSEEVKEKLRKIRTGTKLSDICKEKIGLIHRGRKRSPITEETRLKLKKAMTGKTYSQETCEKKRLSMMGKNKGKVHSEETKKKCRIARSRQLFPFIDTKIELKIKSQLENSGIEFIHPYVLNYYQYDFYIPSKNLLIEADGCYWHSLDTTVKKDILKNKLAHDSGYNLLRIPECRINQETFNIATELKDRYRVREI